MIQRLSSALVKFKSKFAGSISRTVQDKLDDNIHPSDFGLVEDATTFGGGNTDNAASVASFISGKGSAAQSQSMVSSYLNKWGVHSDKLLVSGTHKVLNPKSARHNLVFGQEYLTPWYKNFRFDAELGNRGAWGTPPFVINYAGDSTVVGVGASSDAHKPESLLLSSSVARGFRDVSVVSSAISGDDAYTWYHSGRMAATVNTNPSLMIIRYGVNDGARAGWASEFLDTMRSALTDLRNMRSAAQLPVVLMSPCSTSDPVNHRTEAYHEIINQGLRQLARDFQCCFIDTYGYYQDSHSGSFYMDTSAGDGHVHPYDELYALINKITADAIFPVSEPLMNVNGVRNMGTSIRVLTPDTAVPQAAFQGICFDRLQGAQLGNTPYDGFLYSMKTVELGLLQVSTPVEGVTGGRGVAIRNSSSAASGIWLGKKMDATSYLASGITSSDGALQTTHEGRLHIDGTYNVPAGTSVTLMTLPVELRPHGRILGVVGSTHNGVNVHPFSVEVTGEVIVYTVNSNTTISFSGQSFYMK